jgi:hypothetical protein
VDQIWNTLAKLMLALTVLVFICYIVAFAAPALTPFGPQPTATIVVAMFTPTPKPTAIPPTATPEPTWTPGATPTRAPSTTPRPTRPTNTPRPTIFFTPIPSSTGSPTPTTHPYPFKLSDDGVQFQAYPFTTGCNWLGMAGEVLDQNGEPITGIAVVLNGGGLQNIVTQSGSQTAFGPSGWEHFVDNKVKEGIFTIQLWHKKYASSTENEPVSELVEVRTRKDCRANMAYLVFEVAWDDYVVPQ